ncbi:MAG: transcription antitermination factor NusB [Polyangiales bacterium]
MAANRRPNPRGLKRSRPRRPREVAAFVLDRVARDAAFAAAVLDHELRRAAFSAAQAAWVTEVVYGTLRALGHIDAAIHAHLHQPGARLDALLRAVLRCGSYQLLCMQRVQVAVVVDESVAYVRRARGARLAALANAVLRRVAAMRPPEPHSPTTLQLPAWLAAALQDSLSVLRQQALLALTPHPPPLGLRWCAQGQDAAVLLQHLQAKQARLRWRQSAWSDTAYGLLHTGPIQAIEAQAPGCFVVQELGSQLIGQLTGAQAGERVLDACAGRGHKTLQLLDAVGRRGSVVAVDYYAEKLQHLQAGVATYCGPDAALTCHALDLSVGVGPLGADFDRILVDAPCSGVGTLRRRPDLLLRLTPEKLTRLCDLQAALLCQLAPLLKPGGELVYALCSPLKVEGAAVAARCEAVWRGSFTRLVAPRAVRQGLLHPDADGIWRLGPWLDHPLAAPDAYQLIAWRRTG